MANHRIEREKSTVNSMIAMYCRAHHHAGKALCNHCAALVNYSNARLDRCRFGERKPVCSKCPVHCYRVEPREQIKAVMRFSGPRMLLYKPRLAILHFIDSYRHNQG